MHVCKGQRGMQVIPYRGPWNHAVTYRDFGITVIMKKLFFLRVLLRCQRCDVILYALKTRQVSSFALKDKHITVKIVTLRSEVRKDVKCQAVSPWVPCVTSGAEGVSPRGTDHQRESFQRKSGKYTKQTITVVVTAGHQGWMVLAHVLRSVSWSSVLSSRNKFQSPLCSISQTLQNSRQRQKERKAHGARPGWPQEQRFQWLEHPGRAISGNFGGWLAWWLFFFFFLLFWRIIESIVYHHSISVYLRWLQTASASHEECKGSWLLVAKWKVEHVFLKTWEVSENTLELHG